MNCKKCGYQLEEQWRYCPQCNSEIVENRKVAENSDNTERIYVIIFLVSVALSFTPIGGFAFTHLISLITIVTAKIKCPNSKTISILFWIYLTFVVLSTIFVIVLITMCTTGMSDEIIHGIGEMLGKILKQSCAGLL